MRFSQSTDYALRVLIFLALKENGLSTITEISEAYAISRNHLVKVIHRLGIEGFITTHRGKGGGICLAREPGAIQLGDVIRRMEEEWALVECVRPGKSECRIRSACILPGILNRGLKAFFATLDGYTLRDLLTSEPTLNHILLPTIKQGRHRKRKAR